MRRQIYSVDGDIDVLGSVVRRWLEGNQRLVSPKFIVGESYGGFRGPKLARNLQDSQGIGVSGLVLISPVLDFNGFEAPWWSPMRWVAALPSMVAAARGARSRADVRDAEDYAQGEYLQDLMRGEADNAAVERMATKVAALTGLDPALVRQRKGRIDVGTFVHDREPGRLETPYDATISVPDPFPASSRGHAPDALLDAMRAPLTSAMLSLYDTRLNWQPEGAPERKYEVLNGGVAQQWDYGRHNFRPESYSDLREYLAIDPAVRVDRGAWADRPGHAVFPGQAAAGSDAGAWAGGPALAARLWGRAYVLLARHVPRRAAGGCGGAGDRSGGGAAGAGGGGGVIRAAVFAALAVAGCGYRPPAQTNTDAPAYHTDLTACRATARTATNTQNVKKFLGWVASPVTRWGDIDDAVRTCMADKGYGRLRWCTPEELRTGTRGSGVVVTSAGVQCTDPPSLERRRTS